MGGDVMSKDQNKKAVSEKKRYLFSETTPSPYMVIRNGRTYDVQWWRTNHVVIQGLRKADAEEVASLLNEKLKKSLDRPKATVA